MSDAISWEEKLDPYSRHQVEEGHAFGGANVTVRLAGRDKDKAMSRELQSAGLQLYGQTGDVVVGVVASAADLKNIAQLSCVREVQLSRPLFEE